MSKFASAKKMVMQIYTKKGDGGKTTLYGSGRLSKADMRIHVCGELDELNAFIGAACANIEQKNILAQLQKIQSDIFVIGAMIADVNNKTSLQINESEVKNLELLIDEMESSLSSLKNFILPSGSKAVCGIHIARAVCRRAERAVVACNDTEKASPILLQYLNRLSDYLFVLARFVAKESGKPELLWQP